MDRRDFLRAGSVAAFAGVNCAASTQSETASERTRGQPKYLILTCDGGGMRGYLSSLIMQRLNQDMSIFGEGNGAIDLYAGTSTGGLIALGLAAGNSIDSVVQLYETNGANIFAPLGVESPCVQSLPKILQGYKSVTELYQVQFDDIGSPSVRDVIENFIPGDPVLSSLSNKVMVTTFQLAATTAAGTSWNPLIIDNLEGSPGASTKLYDAALSTSAAPIYFPPYQHPVFGWCSDGGLFANNPAPQAVARAVQAGVPFSDVAVLSIGTGMSNASMAIDGSRRLCYGVNKWASLTASGTTPKLPLFNGIMDGVASTNDYLCGQLLGSNYLRINPVLTSAVSLDDYSPATMKMFQTVAETLFNSEEWNTITKWVASNFTRPKRSRHPRAGSGDLQ